VKITIPKSAPSVFSVMWGYVALAFAVLVSIAAMSPTWARHWPLLWRFRHAFRSHHLALIGCSFFLLTCACLYVLSQIVAARLSVSNASDPAVFTSHELAGFVRQSRDAASLIEFRKYLDGVIEEDCSDLARAVAIRRWVRRQQSQEKSVWLPTRVNHENPRRLLEEQRRGIPGACRRFAYVLTGALLSVGLDARVVNFSSSLSRIGARRHDVVEVWIEDLAKWVLLDPTFDTLVLIDGKPASALELLEAVAAQQMGRITFDRGGTALIPHPTREAYERWCRHLFVAMSNAVFDGYAVRGVGPKRIRFLHHSPDSAYPVFRKSLLLGVSCSGLFLSLVFWAWTFASLVNE